MHRQFRSLVTVAVIACLLSLPLSAAPRRGDDGLGIFSRVIRQIKRILIPGGTEDLTWPKP